MTGWPLVLLAGVQASAPAVEQIAPPTPPAVAARADQPQVPAADRAGIAQLPPDAQAVEQPAPREALEVPHEGDTAVQTEAARIYSAIIARPDATHARGFNDGAPRTLAEAAIASGLATGAPRLPAAPQQGAK